MIRYVHPGSGSRIWIFTHPGSRGQKSTGSWIRIRNTARKSSVFAITVREFRDAGVEAKVWYKVGPDVKQPWAEAGFLNSYVKKNLPNVGAGTVGDARVIE
jgi:hypothetical protein